jgi:hypothetical protein
MITQFELKKLMHYDSETGQFIRLTASHGKSIGDRVGCVKPSGYAQCKLDGVYYYLHRLAWLYVYGNFPKSLDHINGNKSDNRITNLRLANQSENLMNKGVQINNTSGYSGIYFDAVMQKWASRVKVNGKYKYLGCYDTPDLAGGVCDAYRRKYFGVFYKPLNNFTEKQNQEHDLILQEFESVGTRQNSSKRNLAKALESGRAKYCGAQYSKSSDNWVARCWLDGKRVSLGSYATKTEADSISRLFN